MFDWIKSGGTSSKDSTRPIADSDSSEEENGDHYGRIDRARRKIPSVTATLRTGHDANVRGMRVDNELRMQREMLPSIAVRPERWAQQRQQKDRDTVAETSPVMNTSSSTKTYSMAAFVPLTRSTYPLSKIIELSKDKERVNGIIKSGVLMKRSNTSHPFWGRHWSKRYVVVTPGRLWYGKPNRIEKMIELPFGASSITRVNDEKHPFRFSINVQSSIVAATSGDIDDMLKKPIEGPIEGISIGISMHLKASSKASLSSWCDAFDLAINEGGAVGAKHRLKHTNSLFDTKSSEEPRRSIDRRKHRRRGKRQSAKDDESPDSVVSERDALVKALHVAFHSYSKLKGKDIDGIALRHLAHTMHLESYGEGDIIAEEGCDAKKFCVIAKGTCTVLRETRRGVRKEGELDRGDSFGASACLFGVRHAVTVRANKDTTVWATPKAQIVALFSHNLFSRKERRRVLVKNRIFMFLGAEQLDTVTHLMTEKIANAGEHIFEAGDRAGKIYFLVEGTISISAGSGGETSEVDRLYENSCFGELETIFELPEYVASAKVIGKSAGASANQAKLLVLDMDNCRSLLKLVRPLVRRRLMFHIVKAIPDFSEMNPRFLSRIADSVSVVEITQGTCILRHGVCNRRILVLLSGTVIQSMDSSERGSEGTELHRGAIIGSCRPDLRPSLYGYVASTDVEAMCISKATATAALAADQKIRALNRNFDSHTSSASTATSSRSSFPKKPDDAKASSPGDATDTAVKTSDESDVVAAKYGENSENIMLIRLLRTQAGVRKAGVERDGAEVASKDTVNKLFVARRGPSASVAPSKKGNNSDTLLRDLVPLVANVGIDDEAEVSRLHHSKSHFSSGTLHQAARLANIMRAKSLSMHLRGIIDDVVDFLTVPPPQAKQSLELPVSEDDSEIFLKAGLLHLRLTRGRRWRSAHDKGSRGAKSSAKMISHSHRRRSPPESGEKRETFEAAFDHEADKRDPLPIRNEHSNPRIAKEASKSDYSLSNDDNGGGSGNEGYNLSDEDSEDDEPLESKLSRLLVGGHAPGDCYSSSSEDEDVGL